jgi:hypothetical protein
LGTWSGWDSSIDGVALDETGKPMTGVFVIAEWSHYGSDGVGSRTTCPHLEVVQTDAQGRYHIPAWVPGVLPNVHRAVYAYMAGYKEIAKSARPNILTDEEVALNEKKKVMRAYTGTGDERIDSYVHFGYLRGCGPREDRVRKLVPLYRAIHEEAETLKVTDAKKEDLKDYLEFFGEFGDETKDWWKSDLGKPKQAPPR